MTAATLYVVSGVITAATWVVAGVILITDRHRAARKGGDER